MSYSMIFSNFLQRFKFLNKTRTIPLKPDDYPFFPKIIPAPRKAWEHFSPGSQLPILLCFSL